MQEGQPIQTSCSSFVTAALKIFWGTRSMCVAASPIAWPDVRLRALIERSVNPFCKPIYRIPQCDPSLGWSLLCREPAATQFTWPTTPAAAWAPTLSSKWMRLPATSPRASSLCLTRLPRPGSTSSQVGSRVAAVESGVFGSAMMNPLKHRRVVCSLCRGARGGRRTNPERLQVGRVL